jgi:hypothetical protein
MRAFKPRVRACCALCVCEKARALVVVVVLVLVVVLVVGEEKFDAFGKLLKEKTESFTQKRYLGFCKIEKKKTQFLFCVVD